MYRIAIYIALGSHRIASHSDTIRSDPSTLRYDTIRVRYHDTIFLKIRIDFFEKYRYDSIYRIVSPVLASRHKQANKIFQASKGEQIGT